MKLNSYLIIAVVFLITSCKKKENNTSNTTNTTTTGSTNIYPGGELYTLARQFNNGAVSGLEDSVAYAYFFDINAPGNYSNAGNVSYNGTIFANYLNEYQDTTFLVNIHQINSVWNISGSSNVAAFSHTFTPSFPVFNGNSILPDSFSLSIGFTVNFGNSISNVTDTILLVIDNATVKKIAPGQSSCIVTPNDLAFVSVNNGGYLKLEFTNKRTVVYNYREYYLFNNLWHTKYGIKIKT